jgi:hypothetical protein
MRVSEALLSVHRTMPDEHEQREHTAYEEDSQTRFLSEGDVLLLGASGRQRPNAYKDPAYPQELDLRTLRSGFLPEADR